MIFHFCCVGSSWMIHGTQGCASNQPVLLYERSGYLRCTSVCPIHFKMHKRVGRGLGLCILTSAQPLIGLTIEVFSISSALWVLEVLCCLYWHSSYLIDHSTFWWTVVGVSWSTCYQECQKQCLAHVTVVSVHRWAFFPIREYKLIGYAYDYFDGCCAIPGRQSCSGRVTKPWPQQG